MRLRVDDLEKRIAELEAQSSDLNVKIGAETDAAKKQKLTDDKVLLDRQLTEARVELAQARIDRDAKEADYKKARRCLSQIVRIGWGNGMGMPHLRVLKAW